MKCSDVPDREVLEFLAAHQGEWATTGTGYGMPTVQDAVRPGTPYKLQRAKMRQLLNRGLIHGCACGCRGDWEITDKGLEFIGRQRTRSMIG